ncbi:trypsin-like peptidase domain-containing protein [Eubacteriales bacterium OttesenSCG-928-K08]|nr:trypsin-like peptidase domain-containing protein [Eubacteriales bacterium OttesenSCG-928-K08]
MMNNQNWYGDQNRSSADNTKKRGRSVTLSTLIVCMLLTALLGGAVGSVISLGGQSSVQLGYTQPTPEVTSNEASEPVSAGANTTTPPKTNVSTPTFVQGEGYTRAQIVEMVAPSIVGIDVEGVVSWYGQSAITTGSGSGIIVSSDGYIITNDHVVAGSDKIKVYLYDDTEYDAVLVATDSRTDLAVIKIEASGLQPVVMGDSDTLVVGEDVVAIGNPLGELRGTATSGMVSALSRTVTIEGQEMTLLQTDAAINPGNSGGGLFNARGELIGIINAKVASDQTEGLGFAIPVNSAKDVISDLMDLGYVSGRAYLGVYTKDVATTQNGGKNSYGLDGFFGFSFGNNATVETHVRVERVVEGSAAQASGILAGDLIVAVGETKISTQSELSKSIGEYLAGDTATITVQRDGEEKILNVTFGELIPE